MPTIALKEIAYARSGDKGSNSNIGVIAYTQEGYQYLEKNLSAGRVNAYFKKLGVKETVRYELPNLGALNFVLKGVLEGGGSTSLRIDSQGKALGQILLQMPIDIETHILEKMVKNNG
jgi:hypothetical protein